MTLDASPSHCSIIHARCCPASVPVTRRTRTIVSKQPCSHGAAGPWVPLTGWSGHLVNPLRWLNLETWQRLGQRLSDSFFYHISNFDCLQARAQLESGSRIQLVIMSPKIVDSLENIRLGKEKSPWTKILLDHMKLLLNPKFQGTYFCCLRDPELQFLHRDSSW